VAEEEVVWPWGLSDRDPDPSSRPWIFNPRGFLVAVLEGSEEANRASRALGEAGFAEGERRIYAGEQVLDERRRFIAQQGLGRRLVEKLTIDAEAVDLFVDYAENGRAFMWVRVRERKDANRAIRALSEYGVLHFRYYGDGDLEDIHIR
jgi:hypothetical protein